MFLLSVRACFFSQSVRVSVLQFVHADTVQVYDGSQLARVAVRCDSYLWTPLQLLKQPPPRIGGTLVPLQAGNVLFGGSTNLGGARILL